MVYSSTRKIRGAEQVINGRRKTFYGLCSMPCLHEAQHATFCFHRDNVPRLSDHHTQNIFIKPSMYVRCRGRVNTLLSGPYDILVSNFSSADFHLPKNMKIAHIASPLNVIHAVKTNVPNARSIKTLETEAKVDSIASGLSASSKIIHQHSGPYAVLAVHCKPPESQKT